MIKKLASALSLASILLSASAQALPIVQADAFAAGDNKAALQTSTGLVWMDFGINNHLRNIEVVDRLATDYAGWRLPTESEAKGLINDLVDHLPEWKSGYGSFKYLDLSDNTHFDYFNALIDVIGFDNYSTSSIWRGDELLTNYQTKVLTALLPMSTSETGVFHLFVAQETGPYIASSGYFYVESWTYPNYLQGTTLLVKDTITSVPEPSGLTLGLFLLLALVYRRKLAR